jgi:hypothetical protein
MCQRHIWLLQSVLIGTFDWRTLSGTIQLDIQALKRQQNATSDRKVIGYCSQPIHGHLSDKVELHHEVKITGQPAIFTTRTSYK